MALHEGPRGPSSGPPERDFQPLGQWEPAPSVADTVMVVGAGVLVGLGLAWALSKNKTRRHA